MSRVCVLCGESGHYADYCTKYCDGNGLSEHRDVRKTWEDQFLGFYRSGRVVAISEVRSFCWKTKHWVLRRFEQVRKHCSNRIDAAHYLVFVDRWYKLRAIARRSDAQVCDCIKRYVLTPMTTTLKKYPVPTMKNVKSTSQLQLEEFFNE